MAAKRLRWDKLGRKLLKDINFLFEKHKDRVNDARVGELSTDPDSEETEMARKKRELREVEKILEELKAGEISESKLHMIEDVHKAMLKDLFQSMDDDGGGVLDEQELRTLSLTLGYRVRGQRSPHWTELNACTGSTLSGCVVHFPMVEWIQRFCVVAIADHSVRVVCSSRTKSCPQQWQRWTTMVVAVGIPSSVPAAAKLAVHWSRFSR